jgi:pimeloyl-ACP methyl ester carboxylesterase
MPSSEQSLNFQDPAGHRVSAILARPASPTDRIVLLCHGFLSNKNSTTNKTLTRLLLARDIATFRFDFFGQGESQGPFEQITLTTAVDQARAALDLIRAEGFRRIGIMGSSFGGLVAVLTAGHEAGHGRDLRVLGLKCPVPDFPEMLRLEFGDAGMERWRLGQEIPDVSGGTRPLRLHFAFYEDCLTHDAYKAAERIVSPALIVQGDCDELVPLHQSQRLYDALAGPKQLDLIPGADHSFTKAPDFHTMAGLLGNWLIEHLNTENNE